MSQRAVKSPRANPAYGAPGKANTIKEVFDTSEPAGGCELVFKNLEDFCGSEDKAGEAQRKLSGLFSKASRFFRPCLLAVISVVSPARVAF